MDSVELVTIKNLAGRKVEQFHSPKGIMSLYQLGMFWEVVRLETKNGHTEINPLCDPCYFPDRNEAIRFIMGELI